MRHSLGSSSSTRTGKRGVPSSAQRSVALGRGTVAHSDSKALLFTIPLEMNDFERMCRQSACRSPWTAALPRRP